MGDRRMPRSHRSFGVSDWHDRLPYWTSLSTRRPLFNAVRHLLEVVLLLLCSNAGAVWAIEPCALVGNVTASPRHPGLTDKIAFGVSLPFFLFPDGNSNQIVARASVDTPLNISVDVVLTPTPGDFPGWQSVSVLYRADSVFGLVGPLAAGEYSVRTDVRIRDPRSGAHQSVCPDALPRTTLLTVAAVPMPVTRVRVFEYYNTALDHFFVTQDTGEIADLDLGVHPGWSRTGEVFDVYKSGASDSRGHPACRWYGLPAHGLDTHYFSASATECRQVASAPLTSGRWKEETGNAFEATLPDILTGARPDATVPLYRLWNGREDSNHRYTTKVAIKQAMIAKGYIPEGFWR